MPFETPNDQPKPQSNQRGIETQPLLDLEGFTYRPQSNQRGIETAQQAQDPEHDRAASIEPAWD